MPWLVGGVDDDDPGVGGDGVVGDGGQLVGLGGGGVVDDDDGSGRQCPLLGADLLVRMVNGGDGVGQLSGTGCGGGCRR